MQLLDKRRHDTIVQGNQPSLPELRAFCQSESLTEQGLRDRLSHLEYYQRGESTYDNLLLYICANYRVTCGMVEYFLQRFHSSAVNVTLRGVTPLHVVCRNKNATADIVRCVIQYPGDLLKQDEGGQTTLVYLCFNKELDDKSSVEILTSARNVPSATRIRDISQFMPHVSIALPSFAACSSRHIQIQCYIKVQFYIKWKAFKNLIMFCFHQALTTALPWPC